MSDPTVPVTRDREAQFDLESYHRKGERLADSLDIAGLTDYADELRRIWRESWVALTATPPAAPSEDAHPFKDEWSFQRRMTRGNPVAGRPIAPDQPCFTCAVPYADHAAPSEDAAWEALADEGGNHFVAAVARHRPRIEAAIRGAAGDGGLDVEGLLNELAESPLPGARYAYEVVKRRLGVDHELD